MNNKRQNLLIGIVVLVAVLVGSDYFFFSAPQKGTFIKTPDATKNIVTTINKKLTSTSLAPVIKERLFLAVQPWEDDPFLERELIENSGLFTQKQSKSDTQLSFTYSGYVQVGKQLFPVINGIEYAKGELIEETNMQLFRAGKTQIILRDIDSPNDNPRLVTIPIEQEPIFQKSDASRQG